MQTHILSYVRTAQSISLGPVCHTFWSETAKRRRQLAGIYVCTVCMHKKEPQKPPEHASEHVKPQNFLGACPQSPLAQSMYGSRFLYLPWAPPILSAALHLLILNYVFLVQYVVSMKLTVLMRNVPLFTRMPTLLIMYMGNQQQQLMLNWEWWCGCKEQKCRWWSANKASGSLCANLERNKTLNDHLDQKASLTSYLVYKVFQNMPTMWHLNERN